MKTRLSNIIFTVFLILLFIAPKIYAEEPLSPQDLLQLKSCIEAKVSPDGKLVAFAVRIPRKATEKPGRAYNELYLISNQDKSIIPFIAGEVNVSSIKWKPDGTQISFKMKRGKNAVTQVWAISANGGEASQITHSDSAVISYQWHPIEDKIAYTALTPLTTKEKMLKDKGYEFIYFEENLKNRNLYIDCTEEQCDAEPIQLTNDVTVWDFQFSPDGKTIAADISKKNLIDHRFAFRKIYLLNIASKKLTQLTNNPGKLGNYSFNPNGSKIAYCAALTRKDNSVSQLFVINSDGSNLKNLTIPNFIGHVNWVGWKNDNTIIYRAGEKVWSTFSTVKATGGKRKIILHAKDSGLIFSAPSFTKDFKTFIMIASSPYHPPELVSWAPGSAIKKLTNLNPWLADRNLGEQSVFEYKSRDGQLLEGLLIYPTDYQKEKSYPLVVLVHGGPESHYNNNWVSRYSTPGQVLAGKGYFIFYPNYRSSTGYGIDFASTGYGEAAGKEFDDIADGVDALIENGFADKDRVGLGGGSYGGYAAAWFSSYYTKKIKAVCMFVGISDLISKRGTTDIPYEELFVHSGSVLEEMWEKSLKRSPIYYAHQSKTAVLILGGADDTRVHPSQSLEYYRRLKMNDHPAVRLVQYPDEKHGNSKQTSQMDLLYRLLDWYDWYVKDANAFDGPMPDLDISDYYGLDLD
ncbi:MAG: S9 family peptidase [Candidatus Neomarinimicrobiota bacterium]